MKFGHGSTRKRQTIFVTEAEIDYHQATTRMFHTAEKARLADILILDFCLQNCEPRNSFCLDPSVCDVLLEHPWQTKTIPKHSYHTTYNFKDFKNYFYQLCMLTFMIHLLRGLKYLYCGNK